jgi:hypothetical protein
MCPAILNPTVPCCSAGQRANSMHFVTCVDARVRPWSKQRHT